MTTFTPHHIQTDLELRRQLEEEILWEWVGQDSNDLPPEFDEDGEEVAQSSGWQPASKAQRLALECEAFLILFGGKAGVYKSETLLVRFSIQVDNPNYNAIIFRQSFPELRDLIKKSMTLYPRLGGKMVKGSPICWTFPSGATIYLGYMAHDDDVYDHQGQEYTQVGFDEAGHQTEFRIRYMLTRIRSTDKSLKLGMFLTANPGGQCHAALMHTFLRDKCPHCEAKFAVVSGKLYTDATWKSDKQPLSVTLPDGTYIERSVAFINGKLEEGDKDYLGPEYTASLMTQTATTAKMLMDGCWKVWEGQFFDCFSDTRGMYWDEQAKSLKLLDGPDMRMVVNHVDVKPWFAHLVDGDYGFSGSAAAGHLLCRTPPIPQFPNGRVYVLDEYLEKGVTAKDYARELLERWFLEKDVEALWGDGYRVPDVPRSINMWVVSPDAYRKDGSVNDQDVAFSRIEQMNDELAPYGFSFIRANDDRKSGWMKMYQMLRDGELVILSHCKHTIEMFQTRLKDTTPGKFDDIKKVPGDPLDDIADALRYGIMTWQVEGVQPREEKIAEAIRGLDPTNAAMTVRQIEMQERQIGATVNMSPKRRSAW